MDRLKEIKNFNFYVINGTISQKEIVNHRSYLQLIYLLSHTQTTMLLIFKILQINKAKISNPGKYKQKYEQAVQGEEIQLAKMQTKLPTLSCIMEI